MGKRKNMVTLDDLIDELTHIRRRIDKLVAKMQEIAEPYSMQTAQMCSIPGIDTVYFSKCVFPELEKHNLQFLAKSLNINPGHAHRAYDDARVCKEIFELCCKRVLEENINRVELLQDQ